jgi:hypothetical protein
VVNFVHIKCAALPDNFRSEIDFVMWRANAGAELHEHVRGIGSEAINHLFDCVGNDAELGAFATGMNQTDSRRFWIDNVNRAAVGDVNAEHDTALIGDDAIAAREKFVIAADTACSIDNCDFVSMNLLGGEYGPIADADCIPNFPVRCIEPLQRFDFIMRHVDAWNSLRKSVTTDSDRAKRGKLLERRLHHCSKFKIPKTKSQPAIVILSGAKDLFLFFWKALTRDVSLRSTW